MDADAMTTEKRKRLNVISVFYALEQHIRLAEMRKGKEGQGRRKGCLLASLQDYNSMDLKEREQMNV